jgi:hypothetical protein
MELLIYIAAFLSLVVPPVYLYLKDKYMDDCYIDGEYTGFEDYYYCTPIDIIVLESQLCTPETLCEELN